MKKMKRILSMLLAVVLVVGCVTVVTSVETQAATKIVLSKSYDRLVKYGKYTIEHRSTGLFVKNGSKAEKQVVESSSDSGISPIFAVANNRIFYIVNNHLETSYESTIYSIKLNGKGRKKIKQFKDASAEFRGKYGDKVYLRTFDNDTYKVEINEINVKTNKLKKTVSNFSYDTQNQYNQYVIGFDTRTNNSNLYVLNLKNGKKTKVSSKATNVTLSNKKFYYAEMTKKSNVENTYIIKQYNAAGKSKKNMTESFTADAIYTITSKYVEFTRESQAYRYTYKTKEITAI